MSSNSLADEWVDRFGALRGSAPPALNAWLGIPLVTMALLGMLWSLPLPDPLPRPRLAINAATLWVMATFVYYCILSIRLALAGLLFLVITLVPSAWLDRAGLPVWPIASGLFLAAFAWQLTATWQATGRLRIVSNLQYLMLAPIWLLRETFRRAGIPY